jgi:hypothetical protein
MRNNRQKITFALIAIALSYCAALLWWRAWMYQGFWGPIPILHWLVPSDGEASYSLTELEMFVHILFFVSVGRLVYYLAAKKTGIQNAH